MIVRQLDDILGTDREVDTGSWTSRRLVLAGDAVDFSFHDTVIRANAETHEWYKHHYETIYCIEGRGELEDVVDGTIYQIRPGTVCIFNKHDQHRIRAFEDLRLMCVFSPALTGSERPDEHGAYSLLEGARPRGLRPRNVFVIGLNEFNLKELQSIRNAENYEYLRLLGPEDVLERQEYPLEELITKARTQLATFPGPPDALIHYIDFPVSTMVPILCREFGLPSASLEAVLKCEHKYWSRLEQSRSVPEHIPPFKAFDPFDDEALEQLGMPFPFWVKPVKSFSSYLGFRVADERDWEWAISEIRANIGRFAGPFDQLLKRVDLPGEVVDVGGGMCIAEGIIGGRMCTQEGFVHKGEVRVYATIDSIRESNSSSFARYQYPSAMPASVRTRMSRIVERFLKHIRYDNAPFNAEFFWDANEDKIWLLEVNTRISESHCDLFQKVDGASSHEVAVDLSLGHRPRLPYRDGEFAYAAKFFIRRYSDALVTRVPSIEEIQQLQREVPGTLVKVLPTQGMRLSELMDQDSYSYVLATMWIGASTTNQLQKRYEKALDILRFEFA